MSQFTLLASTKKGSKPDFHGAMGGEEAKRLYHHFFRKVQEGYAADKVKNGVFQAMMQVALVNDGPVRASPLIIPFPECAPKMLTKDAHRSRWSCRRRQSRMQRKKAKVGESPA